MSKACVLVMSILATVSGCRGKVPLSQWVIRAICNSAISSAVSRDRAPRVSRVSITRARVLTHRARMGVSKKTRLRAFC